jgi:hypothetical protein
MEVLERRARDRRISTNDRTILSYKLQTLKYIHYRYIPVMSAINIAYSFLQLVLTYAVFITIIVTTDSRILIVAIILFVAVKYLYYLFGSDLFFFSKETDDSANIVTIYSSLITKDFDHPLGEDVFINIGLIIVMNKLFYLLFFKKTFETITGWLVGRITKGSDASGGGSGGYSVTDSPIVDMSIGNQDKINL